MNRSSDILNEVMEISPLVAEIGNANVFSVPEGYFNSIAPTVMACITNDASVEGADAPAGYFDSLSNNILSKIKGTTANELEEISPLLAGITKINPFKVPANYFENSTAEVVSIVTAGDMPEMLKIANRAQPFTVPVGYFETLPGNILNKIKQQSGAQIISMPKRRSLFMQYAAAAVFTGAVILGVFKFTATTNNTGGATAAAINPAITEGIAIAADDNKFKEILNNLDDADIATYLENNGSESDMAVLSSGLDESDLPDQEEYLTDEKVLDNFIEELSLTN